MKFRKLKDSEYLPEVKRGLLQGENPFEIRDRLLGSGVQVSVATLYNYRKALLKIQQNKFDAIWKELEDLKLVDRVNELSLLKAIVAHGSMKVGDATLQQALEAAKILIQEKEDLPADKKNKITLTLERYLE